MSKKIGYFFVENKMNFNRIHFIGSDFNTFSSKNKHCFGLLHILLRGVSTTFCVCVLRVTVVGGTKVSTHRSSLPMFLSMSIIVIERFFKFT